MGRTVNFDYYTKKHVPWVAGLLGNKIEVRRAFLPSAGIRRRFVCVATIFISSIEEFQAAFATHGRAIVADIPNYTNIQPVVQFNEVLREG